MASRGVFESGTCPYPRCTLHFATPYDCIAHMEKCHEKDEVLGGHDSNTKMVKPSSIFKLFPEDYNPIPVQKVHTELNFKFYRKRPMIGGGGRVSTSIRPSECESLGENDDEDEKKSVLRYECWVEGCEKRYKNLQGVKYHMRSAHGKTITASGILADLSAVEKNVPPSPGNAGHMTPIHVTPSVSAVASVSANGLTGVAATIAGVAGGEGGSGTPLLPLPTTRTISESTVPGTTTPATPTKYTQSRPFKCSQCSKRYKTTVGLSNHTNTSHFKPNGDLSNAVIAGTSGPANSTAAAVSASVHEILARSAKEEQAQRELAKAAQASVPSGHTVQSALLQQLNAPSPAHQKQQQSSHHGSPMGVSQPPPPPPPPIPTPGGQYNNMAPPPLPVATIPRPDINQGSGGSSYFSHGGGQSTSQGPVPSHQQIHSQHSQQQYYRQQHHGGMSSSMASSSMSSDIGGGPARSLPPLQSTGPLGMSPQRRIRPPPLPSMQREEGASHSSSWSSTEGTSMGQPQPTASTVRLAPPSHLLPSHSAPSTAPYAPSQTYYQSPPQPQPQTQFSVPGGGGGYVPQYQQQSYPQTQPQQYSQAGAYPQQQQYQQQYQPPPYGGYQQTQGAPSYAAPSSQPQQFTSAPSPRPMAPQPPYGQQTPNYASNPSPHQQQTAYTQPGTPSAPGFSTPSPRQMAPQSGYTPGGSFHGTPSPRAPSQAGSYQSQVNYNVSSPRPSLGGGGYGAGQGYGGYPQQQPQPQQGYPTQDPSQSQPIQTHNQHDYSR